MGHISLTIVQKLENVLCYQRK